jgi:pyruvate dehydrogenase E2 component (dihydrolipoamide acetyltransferase)
MPIEVTMPQMGADMTEGTVVKWLKQVGDQVTRGEIIAEIETDKATVELEAFESGILKQIVIPEGETVPVGKAIALLGSADETIDGEPQKHAPAETPPRRTVDRSAEPVAAVAEPGPNGAKPATPVAAPPSPLMTSTAESRLRISPVARRIASDARIDVSQLAGSGPDGRILRRDVEAAIKSGPQTTPATTEPAPAPAAAAAPTPVAAPVAGVQALSRMRQAIARRMTTSKQTQPHYYLTVDVDMTAAMAFREEINAEATEQQHVSINDLIVKACALALQRHPKFNAEFTEAGLKMHDKIDIDIGIALDDGLIAPALLDCGDKTLGHIAAEAKDLVARAKSGHLRTDEYGAGTFTITNLGAYGVESLIGIINPPQAAILGVGSVMPKPVVHDGQVVVRQVMKIALSADHRVTDGAEGARFIKEIQGLLESPASLAL